MNSKTFDKHEEKTTVNGIMIMIKMYNLVQEK